MSGDFILMIAGGCEKEEKKRKESLPTDGQRMTEVVSNLEHADGKRKLFVGEGKVGLFVL